MQEHRHRYINMYIQVINIIMNNLFDFLLHQPIIIIWVFVLSIFSRRDKLGFGRREFTSLCSFLKGYDIFRDCLNRSVLCERTRQRRCKAVSRTSGFFAGGHDTKQCWMSSWCAVQIRKWNDFKLHYVKKTPPMTVHPQLIVSGPWRLQFYQKPFGKLT